MLRQSQEATKKPGSSKAAISVALRLRVRFVLFGPNGVPWLPVASAEGRIRLDEAGKGQWRKEETSHERHVWGLPRQRKDRAGLREGLERFGTRGLTESMTSDELDAVTAALVGRWYLQGKGQMLGGEHGILLPPGRRKSST